MQSNNQPLRPNQTGYTFDPRVGSGALPQGIQGTAQRAYTRQVNPSAYVENRMTSLLQRNNPFIANARQRANEGSAARGLLNSSMAMGNAERAAIESAMPIVQADAAAENQAAAENLQYLNQMARQDDEMGNRIQIAGIGAAAQTDSASIAQQGALERQRENLAFSGEQAGLDRGHQYGMAQFGLGSDLTRMGYGAQWNNWLGDQETTRGMERDLYNTQLGSIAGYGNALNSMMVNAFNQGMFNPDFIANPQQMTNLLGGISQMGNVVFGNFWQNMFGGNP